MSRPLTDREKAELLDRIVEAWVIEGRYPPLHRRLQRQLRIEWPVLWGRIDSAVKQVRRGRP